MSRSIPGVEEVQRRMSSGIGGDVLNIADDAVGEVIPPRVGGFAHITCNGGTASPLAAFSAMVWFDVGSSLQIVEGSFGTIGANLDVSTSDVTGTTGVDGNVTIAVQSGAIKIENRSSASAVFNITFM